MTMTNENEKPDAEELAPDAAATEPADANAETGEEESLDSVIAEREALRDQLLRAVADAENIRKRAEKEVADTRQFALTNFARDLLSVSDNLSRALSAVSDDVRAAMGDPGKNLLAGVEMTEKELRTVLARHGVTPMDVNPGDRFDPNRHQAAAQIPSEHAAGAVVSAIQSGWVIGERTLRAAMVAVSAGGQSEAPAKDDDASASENGEDPAAEPGGTLDTKV